MFTQKVCCPLVGSDIEKIPSLSRVCELVFFKISCRIEIFRFEKYLLEDEFCDSKRQECSESFLVGEKNPD